MRFTISEKARREVLARLLKLNHERYEEGAAQGLHHKNGKGKSGGKGKARTRGRVEASKPAEPGLFDDARPAPKQSAAEVAESPRRATDEIARNDVIQTIRMVAGSNGELPGDDFITAVARELDFARTGKRIHEEIDNAIRAADRRGIVETGLFGVRANCVKISDWSRDALIDALRSVMRRGANYEREDAITLAATHLGLNRVGKKVDEAFRSAIRRGILNHEGNLIWREA